MLGAAFISAMAGSSPEPERVERGYALYRLPGRTGRSCLSCHAQSPQSQALTAVHVTEQFGPLPEEDFQALLGYLRSLHAATTVEHRTEAEELVRSMQSLGYLGYGTREETPVLSEDYSLNAYELFRFSTGNAEVVKDAESPTGQALEFSGSNPAGVILPELTVLPGRYVLLLRTGDFEGMPVRLLITAADKDRRDVPLTPTVDANYLATEFSFERKVRITLSLVISGKQRLRLSDLAIARK